MICVRLMGGLGNQMFQYALGRHLALKNRTELVVDTTYFELIPSKSEHFVKRKYDLDIFNVETNILNPKETSWLPCYSANPMHKIKHCMKKYFNLYERLDSYKLSIEKVPFSIDNEILKASKNTYLIGYWQNEEYFKDIEAQIRHDFTFRNTFDKNVHELAQEINSVNSICLNIRRGDFVNNPTHGFVGLEYVYKAVNRIRGILNIDKVYVFSDEIDWCIRNLRLDVPHFFVTYAYAGEKFSSYLYLMTKCRHFIISNSTFGWWGAWLSEYTEKMVIAPKRWVNIPGLDASGIIPEGWISM